MLPRTTLRISPLFSTQALIPVWSWWIISIICSDTPKRTSTCQISVVRSSRSHVVCWSLKHRNSGTRAFLSSSCGLQTTNSISVVDRSGWNPYVGSTFRWCHTSLIIPQNPRSTIGSWFCPSLRSSSWSSFGSTAFVFAIDLKAAMTSCIVSSTPKACATGQWRGVR